MLGSLAGIVTAHLGQQTLIEVNGVGYWVSTGSWQPSGELTCYLHHHIREDASDLYGFIDLPTLALFEQLISISGVGPKAAMAVLSVGSIDRIQQAIHSGDATFLTLAPGIGNKAAQKIILELKGKVGGDAGNTIHADILEALTSLGYRQADVSPYLVAIPSDKKDIDTQIKWVLQQLSRKG
jgi:Holliday junction DNA helicase RuvA